MEWTHEQLTFKQCCCFSSFGSVLLCLAKCQDFEMEHPGTADCACFSAWRYGKSSTLQETHPDSAHCHLYLTTSLCSHTEFEQTSAGCMCVFRLKISSQCNQISVSALHLLAIEAQRSVRCANDKAWVGLMRVVI